MAAKEARARIKINKLLEESGWRFFDNDAGKANIVLEPNVKLTKNKVNDLERKGTDLFFRFRKEKINRSPLRVVPFICPLYRDNQLDTVLEEVRGHLWEAG